jgi:hypothetical protein
MISKVWRPLVVVLLLLVRWLLRLHLLDGNLTVTEGIK